LKTRTYFNGGLGIVVAALLAVAAPAGASGQGLELVSTKHLSPRLVELTLRTPALVGETRVRVLLPAGYDGTPDKRYPVLYLLNGALDDETAWTVKGDAEPITAPYPLIVVMPDGGEFGNYVNWYNDGAFGPPEWETYHVDQLVPWIDGHFRTAGRRAGRAIAGLSMGGGGAMKYAARHPELFAAAAGFSAAVDTNSPGVQGVTQASGLADGSKTPGAIYGMRTTDEVRWRASNAWDLAGNLEGMDLWLRTGNGSGGGPGGDSGDVVEYEVHTESVNLHQRLVQLGISHLWDDYGAGGHAWFYWQRDLRQTLPGLMRTFADPPAPPSPFSFVAAEPRYRAYGWRVAIDRPALEFSQLRDADAGGFELRGSGSATVTTAGLYQPRSVVRATVRSGSGTEKRELRAGDDGRVAVAVPLGPGNPAQEYSPEATGGQAATGPPEHGAPGTTLYTARVALAGTLRSGACTSPRAVKLKLAGLRRSAVRRVVVRIGRRRTVLRGPRAYVIVRVAAPTRVRLEVLTRGGRTLRFSRMVRPPRCG
jgi:S-formylglutathione hydrolase FrmB